MGGGGSRSTSYTKKSPIGKKTVNNPESTGLECQFIEEEGTLLNQNISFIRALYPGDVLKVQLDTSSDAVIAVNSKGEICGNISISSLDQLIKCLKKGFLFKANILRINPIVSIEVQSD